MSNPLEGSGANPAETNPQNAEAADQLFSPAKLAELADAYRVFAPAESSATEAGAESMSDHEFSVAVSGLEQARSVFLGSSPSDSDYEGKKAQWIKKSSEIISGLNNIDRIREASFYLSDEDKDIADKKWDEIAAGEVEQAKTVEEILKAFENVRPGGYNVPITQRDELSRKYAALTGKSLRQELGYNNL